MSVEDFTEMMTGLDEIAKDTGLSVQTVQTQLKGFMDTIGATGGVEAQAAAAQQFAGLLNLFPAGLADSGLGERVIPSIISRGAILSGVSPMFATSKEIISDPAPYIKRIIDMLKQLKASIPPNTNAAVAQFLVASGQAEFYGLGGLTAAQIEIALNSLFKLPDDISGLEREINRKNAERAIGTAREDLKQGREDVRGLRGFKVGGVDSFLGERRYLQELKTTMEASGVSKEEIDNVLRPLRDVVFNKRGRGFEERKELFEQRTRRVEEDFMQVTFGLSPEAARIFEVIDDKRNSHIFGGKGSQGTIKPPVMRSPDLDKLRRSR